MGCTAAARFAPEPAQQRVAGRVAEAVVVRLEAVEVEEREQVRALARLERVLEVEHQAAAVAETR